MHISISDISELEQAIRSIFNPDWAEVGSARAERFSYVWTATMAQVHYSKILGSTLYSKIRTFILDNLSLALIDSSEYVRTWAEYISKEERSK
jgi:hypothetical protein